MSFSGAPGLAALLLLLGAGPGIAAEFSPSGEAAVRAILGPPGAAAGAAAPCERCHVDVAAQWSSSAHRFSSLDNPYYSFAFDAFRAEKGLAASRFCAGCHDPVLLAAGAIDRPFDDVVRGSAQARAGIACLVCHAIDDGGDLHANGNYHVALPAEIASPRTAAHRQQLRRPAMAEARFCATCHKVGLGPEVTGDRWIRGQDDWDAWRLAAISGHGAASVRRPASAQRCQDCHMPFEAASASEAGARARPEVAGFAPGTRLVRSHRFLGGNTALPAARGDGDMVERTRAFLAGAVSVDVHLVAGEAEAAGAGAATIERGGWLADVVLRARRVGHRFPGGTMDSNEVWLEVEAVDGHGRLIGRSGGLDATGRLDPSAHLVRAQPVDAQGDPIARRDVQHLHGVAWDTSVPPSDPIATRYRLPRGTARVRARLLYRKLSAEYTRAACAALREAAARRRCEALPVIEVGRDQQEVRLAQAAPCGGSSEVMATARAAAGAPAAPGAEAEALRRALDHGLALADALVEQAGEAEAILGCVAQARPGDVEPWLGLARVALAQGRIDDAVRLATRAREARPDFPAAFLLEARALYQGYRFAAARPPIERLLTLLPDDSTALSLAARIRGVLGDPAGALAAADLLAALDPDLDEAHYQRAVALRELGRAIEAESAERDYLRYRVAHEVDLEVRGRYRGRHPLRAQEDQPLHVHSLAPVR